MIKAFCTMLLLFSGCCVTFANDSQDVQMLVDEGGENDTRESQSYVDIFERVSQEAQGIQECDRAQIIAINKITTKHVILNVPVGQAVYFDNAEIRLLKCLKQNDPYNKDDYGLVSVHEKTIDDDPRRIFRGWLIGKSPSISTLEHPVYEIMLKKCGK